MSWIENLYAKTRREKIKQGYNEIDAEYQAWMTIFEHLNAKIERVSQTSSWHDETIPNDDLRIVRDERDGLYGKYEVYKDGEPIEDDVFVLRFDRDHHAQAALFAYALSVQCENPQLAIDLLDELNLKGFDGREVELIERHKEMS